MRRGRTSTGCKLSCRHCPARQPVRTGFYGVQPDCAKAGLIPVRCAGKVHQPATLGFTGRRVFISREWSGKTLTDHRADNRAWVKAILAGSLDEEHQDQAAIRATSPADTPSSVPGPMTPMCHPSSIGSCGPSPPASDGDPRWRESSNTNAHNFRQLKIRYQPSKPPEPRRESE